MEAASCEKSKMVKRTHEPSVRNVENRTPQGRPRIPEATTWWRSSLSPRTFRRFWGWKKSNPNAVPSILFSLPSCFEFAYVYVIEKPQFEEGVYGRSAVTKTASYQVRRL